MLTTDYIQITLLRGNPFPPSDVIKKITLVMDPYLVQTQRLQLQ